eukprot:6730420-Pyramimonas_sp.AAC.1
MHEQSTAFMLQDDEVRTIVEASIALPEPPNPQRHADWAIEREPATVDGVNAFIGSCDPATLQLSRTSTSSTRGGSRGRW